MKAIETPPLITDDNCVWESECTVLVWTGYQNYDPYEMEGRIPNRDTVENSSWELAEPINVTMWVTKLGMINYYWPHKSLWIEGQI